MPTQRPVLALALRLTAVACLAAMLALVRLASERGVHLLEIVFWRQAGPMVLIALVLAVRRDFSPLRTERMPAHVRRTAIGLVGMFLNLGSVLLLPLAEATILGFTSPLFAVILAALLLRERVGKLRWSAVTIGFLGVIVISGFDNGGGVVTPLGLAVGVGGAFMVALIAIQLRDLGRTEKPLTVVFWFSTLSTVLVAPSLLLSAGPHDELTWLILGGIGVLGLAGQLALTAALRLGAVSSVIVMDYSSLFWATLWGWLLWQQLPPPATWLGAPLIIAAGLFVVWREHRLAREKPVGPITS